MFKDHLASFFTLLVLFTVLGCVRGQVICSGNASQGVTCDLGDGLSAEYYWRSGGGIRSFEEAQSDCRRDFGKGGELAFFVTEDHFLDVMSLFEISSFLGWIGLKVDDPGFPVSTSRFAWTTPFVTKSFFDVGVGVAPWVFNGPISSSSSSTCVEVEFSSAFPDRFLDDAPCSNRFNDFICVRFPVECPIEPTPQPTSMDLSCTGDRSNGVICGNANVPSTVLWYNFLDVETNFFDAELQCKNNFGDSSELAFFRDTTQFEAVMSSLGVSSSTSVWIGLTNVVNADPVETNHFEWTSVGIPNDFFDVGVGVYPWRFVGAGSVQNQPNKLTNENCVRSLANELWDFACTDLMKSICITKISAPTTSPIPIPSASPTSSPTQTAICSGSADSGVLCQFDDATPETSLLYSFVGIKRNWTESRKECKLRYGSSSDLAYFTSIHQFNGVVDVLGLQGVVDDFWIGLNNSVNQDPVNPSDFQWTTPGISTQFSNVDSGSFPWHGGFGCGIPEPDRSIDNSSNIESCGMIRFKFNAFEFPGGRLFDAHCSLESTFLCVQTVVSPTSEPSVKPTFSPLQPSTSPTVPPTRNPTNAPSFKPTSNPSVKPTFHPSFSPTQQPTFSPTFSPSTFPTVSPTSFPSISPTFGPIEIPPFAQQAGNGGVKPAFRSLTVVFSVFLVLILFGVAAAIFVRKQANRVRRAVPVDGNDLGVVIR